MNTGQQFMPRDSNTRLRRTQTTWSYGCLKQYKIRVLLTGQDGERGWLGNSRFLRLGNAYQSLPGYPPTEMSKLSFKKRARISFDLFGCTFLLPSPFPFSSRIKSAKCAVALTLLIGQARGLGVQWVPELLVRLRAQNIPSPSELLGGGGDIILKVICIVLIHLPLPKWFILNPHNHSYKNSTVCVWEGILYLSQSLTTVDLFILFLELRMNWITGIIETEIP